MSRAGDWIAPFPRLRYRLRTGRWCAHPTWTRWVMINAGSQQLRRCDDCEYSDFR